MMNRISLFALVGMLSFGTSVNAVNPYESLRNSVIRFGEKIDNINVPILGKLLPIAMIAACFKECPGQTMVVLGGLLAYALSQNETVCSALSKYNFMSFMQEKNQINALESDENLFVFDGDDSEDAQDQEEIEDEMLDSSLLDEEYHDENHHRKANNSSTIKFL